MKHKNCGGNIVLDLSSVYIINSPTIVISTKGMSPGMIQIDSSPGKNASKLSCNKCGESFSGKEKFEEEILGTCSICNKEFPPSELKVNDYIPMVCNECLDPNSKKKVESLQRSMLALYQEVLMKQDNPTLLTILMKKI